MNMGLFGGIIGGLVGVIGGLIGTYFSIKNTNGPKERRFMIKAAVIGWVGIAIFLIVFYLIPSPYRWFLWIPYGILLPIAIITCNKRQAQIRAEEAER